MEKEGGIHSELFLLEKLEDQIRNEGDHKCVSYIDTIPEKIQNIKDL